MTKKTFGLKNNLPLALSVAAMVFSLPLIITAVVSNFYFQYQTRAFEPETSTFLSSATKTQNLVRLEGVIFSTNDENLTKQGVFFLQTNPGLGNGVFIMGFPNLLPDLAGKKVIATGSIWITLALPKPLLNAVNITLIK